MAGLLCFQNGRPSCSKLARNPFHSVVSLTWPLVTFSLGLQEPALPDDRVRVQRCIAELEHMVLPAEPSAPRPEILPLGTFHFDDQGLDEYKPKDRFDIGGD